MKQTKASFLLVSLNAGGIETYLLRFLKLYGHDISTFVVVKNGKKGDLYDEYIQSGTKIIPLKMGYLNVIAWFRLFKFFKYEKIETVCDMSANFAGITMTIARIAGIKKRIAFYRQSSHHFTLTTYNLAYANVVNWLVYKNATTILANSQHAFNFYFAKKIDDRCKVIKNGVNKELFEIKESKSALRKYFGLPEDCFIVGHTGRVAPAKNHQTILRVAAKICFDMKNVIFVLAGNGTQQLPDQEGVIALGYCREIPELLKTFDLFYFPSLTEGQPNALIEAMVMGLPFVASDIEAIKECVPENHYSQLVPATDIDAGVEKIKEMIHHRNKNQFCCQEWAMEAYDANRNFHQFFNELKAAHE